MARVSACNLLMIGGQAGGGPPKKDTAREVGACTYNNAYFRAVCTQKLHTSVVCKTYGSYFS